MLLLPVFEFIPIHNLRIEVWNVNSFKPRKLELVKFLIINIIDIAAISDKRSLQNRYSMPGMYVHIADRNQFSGGVMFVVKNHMCHEQFALPNVLT